MKVDDGMDGKTEKPRLRFPAIDHGYDVAGSTGISGSTLGPCAVLAALVSLDVPVVCASWRPEIEIAMNKLALWPY